MYKGFGCWHLSPGEKGAGDTLISTIYSCYYYSVITTILSTSN